MNGLGAFVREQRERRGMSQERLAFEVGVPRAYLSQIEAGRVHWPNAGLRRDLARVLGVRHVDLAVAAGELTADEIGDVAPRWPTRDPARVEALELVEGLPDDALAYTVKTLGMIRDARWTPPR